MTNLNHVHTNRNAPIYKWAGYTSESCEASNPNHVNGDDAFTKGRVAYQARALGDAACWFTISSDKGVKNADSFLGILYAFGLGLPKDPARAFEHMQKGASSGDAYAMMYFANFYRYGVGTRPSDDQFATWRAKALRLPEGIDANIQVQGIGNIGLSQIAGALDTSGSCDTHQTKSQYDQCISSQHASEAQATAPPPIRHTMENPEEILPDHIVWFAPDVPH